MRRFHGFTLVELLICLGIGAILMTLAVPSFNELIHKTKAYELRQSLFHMMQFSRQAAINQDRTITICQIKDLKTGQCIMDTHWQYPYYIFFDANGDQMLNLDDKKNKQVDTLLRQYPAVTGTESLYTTRKYFTFSPPGTTRHSGSLTYCPPNYHSSASRIVVMRSGRVRYARTSEIKCPEQKLS